MKAEQYRRMAEVENSHWWYVATRKLLRQELGPRLTRGGRFLDAGSGTGATGAWMAEFGSLVATDLFTDALSIYTELHPEAIGGLAADLFQQPFADDSFDAALCVTVLYHQWVADPVAAVSELARAVRPGGYVCLIEPGVRRLVRAHDRENLGARRFSLRDLRTIAEDAGLHVERATGAHSYLIPLAAVKTLVERGRAASDLDNNESGLGGVLGKIATAERALLRRTRLPAGLSVMVIARVPF
jgi:SAM-dependent methyltransferase